MANLLEQEEASYRERRELEREQQRREQRLEELREQAREEEREREKEEASRLEALEQTRAYAAEEQRRTDRKAATLARIRDQRRIDQRRIDAQTGRLAAARAAADVARRALAAAQQAAAEREVHARQQRLAESRSELHAAASAEARAAQRADDRRAERGRDARAATTKQQRAAAGRLERQKASRENGRAEAHAAAQSEKRREATTAARRAENRNTAQTGKRRDEARAVSRQESRSAQRATERREQLRAGQRQEAQAKTRSGQRRNAALAALQERSTTTSGGSAGLRVLGPLLLDTDDRPVRLRGVHVPGFDTAEPAADGTYAPPLGEQDLDLLTRWDATLVTIPVALDRLFTVPDTHDPRVLMPPDLIPAADDPEDLGVPSEPYLEALDTAIDAAADRGLYTVVQLSAFRRSGDDRPVPFAALRRFWQVVGQRWADTPSVLFDLLRAPQQLEPFLRPGNPGDPVVTRQLQTILLALLGELRSVHPGAVAIVESVAGTLDVHPLTYTNGQLAPGVLAGYRGRPSLDPSLPPELFALARRMPVVVLGWGNEQQNSPIAEPMGRRLAAAGLHWVMDAWPATGTVSDDARLVPTIAGRSTASALAQPEPLVGTSASTGEPALVRPPLSTAVGGGGGLPGIPRLLANLVLGAAPLGPPPPPPKPLPAVIVPRSPTEAYLPTSSNLRHVLQALDRADRSTRISAWLAAVQPHWTQAVAAGTVATLLKIREVEKQARLHGPRIPGDLAGKTAQPAVPRFLREGLDLDATTGASLGRALVTGGTTVSDAARTAWLSSQAIAGLRRLDDILGRMAAARACAAQTGADLAIVLALYRTEGALAMPPSTASIDAGIPSGTADATTFLTPRPDITHLVWLANATPLAPYSDNVIRTFATSELVMQVAGLDVVAQTDVGGPQYVKWSHQTWKAAGIDDLGQALARGLFLQQAVQIRHLGPPPPRRPAVAALVDDPVKFIATALGDGVQLLRSLADPTSLLAPPPLPAGVAATLAPSLAYLRYNIGDDQTKLALGSAVLAAARTTVPRWAPLRSRIRSLPSLRPALAKATATNGNPHSKADKATAAAHIWIPLQPWLLLPGNVEAVTEFVEQATAAEWPDWLTPRANVARFRILLDFYTRLTSGP